MQELNGPATDATWNPGLEVFADRDHIANSAMHLTLMQTSKATLIDVINQASYYKKGTVYSAIPQIRDGKGLVDVKIATPDGQNVTVTYDLRSASIIRN